MKANNKHIKDYRKNNESSYINYWDLKNLYGWIISQKLSLSNYKWVKETFQFKGDFINDLPFFPEKMKLEKVKKPVTNLHDKKRIFYTHKKFKTSNTS